MALSDYILALRPWSLLTSLIPVCLGAVLGYRCYEELDISLCILTVLCVVAVHSAGNAVNTYYDYEKGVDTTQSDDRILVDHKLQPVDVVSLGMYLYGFGMLCLWCILYWSKAKSELIALLFFCGLSGSFLYTGGGLKYYALGDLVVMILFGPLAVLFSFAVQTGRLMTGPLVLAVPIALHTEAALHANNTRDIEMDRRAKVVTLASLLGQQGAYILFVLLLLLPYLVYMIWGLQYSGYLALPLATMPFSFRLLYRFGEGKLRHLPKDTAKMNTVASLLFLTGCYLATDIPFLQYVHN